MRLTMIVGGVAAAALATAVFAHEGATGVVKDRMEAMKAMGESVKTLSAMMRGETALDPEVVRTEAERIADHAGEAMTELFPDGSTGKPSEAKEAIWSDWDDFAALADDLAEGAKGLALAAANPPMAQAGGSGMMGSGMMDGGGMMAGGMMSGAHMNLTAEEIGEMPVDGAFNMLSQTCSACHTRFREEDD
ncbi:c-type cytochrome [Halovulum sp. GXIMD14794]